MNHHHRQVSLRRPNRTVPPPPTTSTSGPTTPPSALPPHRRFMERNNSIEVLILDSFYNLVWFPFHSASFSTLLSFIPIPLHFVFSHCRNVQVSCSNVHVKLILTGYWGATSPRGRGRRGAGKGLTKEGGRTKEGSKDEEQVHLCSLFSLHPFTLFLTSLPPTRLAMFWNGFPATHCSIWIEMLVTRRDHSSHLPPSPLMLQRDLSALNRDLPPNLFMLQGELSV